ncbi:Glycogen operon protein GlgX [bacterium HR29]|jgi:isoamylase|nr:Glycogen operon protein GlgX [bacterium HR29]
MKRFATQPGAPYPLGATWDGSGVNFALFSENAEHVELCIFDRPYGAQEIARIPIREQTDFVWHVYLPEARPGMLYGYRVYGPYRPEEGLRFNPHKLLLDPYAKAVTGPVHWSEAMFGYDPSADEADPATIDLRMSTLDSAPGMPKSVVVESAFSWGDDRRPAIPWHDTVIYELHVKGFTYLNPDLPEELRGTYAGLAHRETIRYLKSLGVTAVELMPVHFFVDDWHLLKRGLRNYWGYNTIGFFAPDPRYAAFGPESAVAEFKTMVRTLHQAGIEVILDVVYNHTAEGDHLGPTLSFRGIDNQAYYRLVPGEPRRYMDFTGTGNTFNMLHPRAIQLIMDSLRYWVTEMHVDGFRFDLASALARELYEVDRLSAFFEIIHQDPVISQVKLIAEPWDLGEGGYQVGNFPVGWAEWNGKYRDNVRRFWRGDAGQVGELGFRLTGSSDLYAHNGRRPYASINFVTCHDGFTLRDLVSYERKHNEANGEGNRDGTDANWSENFGVEGDTEEEGIIRARFQQMRNFIATLFVSQGVPMLLHGDEVARTQRGNNNAYCQDNEISWMPWQWDERQRSLLEWTRRLVALRKRNPVLRRRGFLQGRPAPNGEKDIAWLREDGRELTEADWADPERHVIGLWLSGAAADLVDREGRPITGETLVILLNASKKAVAFHLPTAPESRVWSLVLDSARPELHEGAATYRGGAVYPLAPRSLAILQHATERPA